MLKKVFIKITRKQINTKTLNQANRMRPFDFTI